MDDVRVGNLGGGLASPYPLLGATILFSSSACSEKNRLSFVIFTPSFGDPDDFVLCLLLRREGFVRDVKEELHC